VELDFSSKNGLFRLIFELFSTGNIILCDETYTIQAAAEQQAWSTRKIAIKEVYKLPPQRFDIFSLTASQMQQSLRETNKDSLVKALAVDLGLGGVYAEELCLLSSLNKLSKPQLLGIDGIKKILSSWQQLLKKKPQPVVVFKDKTMHDVVPFPLRYYDGLEQKEFNSYNEALDFALTKAVLDEEKQLRERPKQQAIAALERRISEQRQMIQTLSKAVEENTRKGELMYEHYQELQQLLSAVKSKKSSLQQLKEKHKILKNLDEKTWRITVELQ
jgi:predicted ribosome quality control (RQC) complex YloA/Tae2 family protein